MIYLDRLTGLYSNTNRRHPVSPRDPQVAQAPMTGKAASLAGLLLLFVASRLLYLVLIDPGFLDLYGGEELYRGTIAHEIVTGLKLPFTEYRADDYSGGSLVIGALAAAPFLLFGSTLFALKLAPLFLYTLTLVFWYWTVQRAAGEQVARNMALLFCFSPPLFTSYSVTAMGFHSESIVFSALSVFLLFRMLSDETESPALPTLLGLSAGFGLWFAYIYGLTLLTMLGFWFWYDKEMRWRRLLWFVLGFVLGFTPWILINLQTHFAGLVIYEAKLWDHFGLAYLLDDLANPWNLVPVQFFANLASEDPRDLPRRAVNILYSLLYLSPLLAASILHLKSGRSRAATASPSRGTLVRFAVLYVIVLVFAMQFSDFRNARYQLPASPFVFFLVARALALCQDLVPSLQRQIQSVFLASALVLGLGTHAPLLSLDWLGYTLSSKGYSYAMMPESYSITHTSRGLGDHQVIMELIKRPFLSDILPKLSSDDQRELSLGIVRMLIEAVQLNGQAEGIYPVERLVPAGFKKHFSYMLGVRAMARHPDELSKAVMEVEPLRHRSSASYHLALVGIYRTWPDVASLDASPESLVKARPAVAPDLLPYYWSAIGHLVCRHWYETDRSLSQLSIHLQSFVPRLEPTVRGYFLQGIGQCLFAYPHTANWVPPGAFEQFPHAYQQDLWVGWGIELGKFDLFSPLSWKNWRGQKSPFGTAWTKGLSERSLGFVQHGKAQVEALFEGES